MSDCKDIALINVLDGISLQPGVTVPFDSDIDPASVNSSNAFFVELGNADVDAPAHRSENGTSRVIGVNQLVWDPATRLLAAESDAQLQQHTRYAFVLTKGVLKPEHVWVRTGEVHGPVAHFKRISCGAYVASSTTQRGHRKPA